MCRPEGKLPAATALSKDNTARATERAAAACDSMPPQTPLPFSACLMSLEQWVEVRDGLLLQTFSIDILLPAGVLTQTGVSPATFESEFKSGAAEGAGLLKVGRSTYIIYIYAIYTPACSKLAGLHTKAHSPKGK